MSTLRPSAVSWPSPVDMPSSCPCFGDAVLPRAFRDDVAHHLPGASWSTVLAAYGAPAGHWRLGSWECTGTAGRLGADYRATLAVGSRIVTATAAAGGPLAALTAMLAAHGGAVEMLAFHQVVAVAGGGTATVLRCGDGRATTWSLGVAADAGESARRALVAGANRLRADARGD